MVDEDVDDDGAGDGVLLGAAGLLSAAFVSAGLLSAGLESEPVDSPVALLEPLAALGA